MINNISFIPFKINIDLLDFIKLHNDEYGFLINPNVPHKNENLLNRTLSQEKELKAHDSKIILEITILSIIEFYKNYPNIYFPVRSDQRGRLYCMPHYFNYQDNELSRALLLFAEPGHIHKSNLNTIKYLKLYGANCYGMSKVSNDIKIKFINDNKYNILNYENSGIIHEAEDKLLFLSFCMEYKRYLTLLDNEEAVLFLL